MTAIPRRSAASEAARDTVAPRPVRRMVRRLEQGADADALADRLEPLAAAFGDGPAAPLLRGEWLGHALHPLLTDLPLGCWMSANLLDLVGGRSAAPAAQRLVGLGLLAVPPTVASGFADWHDASDDERVRRVGAVHAAGNTVVGALYLGSWLARRRGRRARGVVLALAGGVLAIGTGYLGGHLSFARGAGHGARGLADEPGRARSTDEEPVLDLTDAALSEPLDAPGARLEG